MWTRHEAMVENRGKGRNVGKATGSTIVLCVESSNDRGDSRALLQIPGDDRYMYREIREMGDAHL